MGRRQQGPEGKGRFTSTEQQGRVEDSRVSVGLLVLSSNDGEGSRDRRVRVGLLVLSSREEWGTTGTGG